MDEQARASTVRSYYDHIDAENYDALFELFGSDVTYHRPGQRKIDGIADFQTFYLEERPLSDGEHEVHKIVSDGNTVAVRGRFTGIQDGAPVELGFADFHRFEEGKIVERYTYTDRDTV